MNFLRLLQVTIWKQTAGFVLLISSVANIAACEEFKNLSMIELLEAVDSSLSSFKEKPQNQTSFVKLLQTELNRLGCGAGIVDGVKGKKTQRAIEKFKNASNLKQNIGPDELLAVLQRTSKVNCAENKDKLKPKSKSAAEVDTYPVKGKIIRQYVAGKTDGVDIAARAGSPILSIRAGVVAAVTQDVNRVPIVVIKHANNLLTVYAHLSEVNVKKGDAVTKGHLIARVPAGNPAYMHFEVRKGLNSINPNGYLD